MDFVIKKWIDAARFRTLPLSLSGIVMGAGIARWQMREDWDIWLFVLALGVTLCYQILSNFANDYGDSVKGTDAGRINGAEVRAVASGQITLQEMKRAIVTMVVIALVMTILLLLKAFYPDYLSELWIFLGLGGASIMAAIGYTVGKNAYGYLGLGDLMVFLFFGLLGVGGSFFLFTKTWDWAILLPASAIGLLSTAVLNLNNMRDIENDAKSGKKTLALRLGKGAVSYQMLLLTLPLVLVLLYMGIKGLLKTENYYAFIFMILIFPLAKIRRSIREVKNPVDYDKFLKQVGILTFVLSLMVALGLNLFAKHIYL